MNTQDIFPAGAAQSRTTDTAAATSEVAAELNAMVNWIEPYRDVLSDAASALSTIQHRIQAMASTGRDVPVDELLEMLDMVDADYLNEELPGAMTAFDDSLVRMRRMSDPTNPAPVETVEDLELDDLAPQRSATVIAFRPRS